MTTKAGKDGRFYIATDDDIDGTPTWTELTIVEDVEQDSTKESAEVKNRASDEITMLALHRKRQVTCTITHTPGNAVYESIRDAFENDTALAIAVMDGAVASAGSEGLMMDVIVTQFKRSEQLSQRMAYDVTFEPSAAAGTTPAWTEVSA